MLPTVLQNKLVIHLFPFLILHLSSIPPTHNMTPRMLFSFPGLFLRPDNLQTNTHIRAFVRYD